MRVQEFVKNLNFGVISQGYWILFCEKLPGFIQRRLLLSVIIVFFSGCLLTL